MNQSKPLEGLTATYLTLGCKLNFAETATVADALRQAGATDALPGQRADICVVNTCSVTEVADSKSRQAIRRLARQHPGATVAVMGCYAQLRPQEAAAIPGVTLVLGTHQKLRAPHHIIAAMQGLAAPPASDIGEFAPSCSCGSRTRYFLKVQDGCDYRCTYCTIPAARGRSRNGTVAQLVGQARDVASRGGREIVLTGVNIGDFGRTTGESLIDLVRALDQVEGIQRYRISSIEPNLLTDELLRFCAASRAFMPHFHLPLQSGSDEVLRLMGRRYRADLFRARVERIRELMPHAFVGADVIVGSRGETERLFQESLAFMRAVPVSQYHVFAYSERAGTAALRIPHAVPPQQKRERSQQVIDLSQRRLAAFYASHSGTVRPVLMEHGGQGGFTDNYIKVHVSGGQDGQVQPVRLGPLNAAGTKLTGTLDI